LPGDEFCQVARSVFFGLSLAWFRSTTRGYDVGGVKYVAGGFKKTFGPNVLNGFMARSTTDGAVLASDGRSARTAERKPVVRIVAWTWASAFGGKGVRRKRTMVWAGRSNR
jgi:hypothetical protein